MKCNKRLKYCNYVAFSHFHGTAVNNSGLITAFEKKEQENLTMEEKNAIKKLVKALKEEAAKNRRLI